MRCTKKLSLLVLLLFLFANHSFAQPLSLQGTLDYINKTLDVNQDMVRNRDNQIIGVNSYAVSVSNTGMLQVRKICKSSTTGQTCSYVSMIAINDIDTTFTYYKQQQADSPSLKHIYINCQCDTIVPGNTTPIPCSCVKSFYDKVNSTGNDCSTVFLYYDRIEIVFSNKDEIENSLSDAVEHLVKLLVLVRQR